MSTAELHHEFMEEDASTIRPRGKRKPKDRSRSARNSLARALRHLEATGEIRRDSIDRQWYPTEEPGPDPELKATAYHETGHAVIGLAKQRPVGFATITPKGRAAGYVTGVTDRPNAIGEIYTLDRRTRKYIRIKIDSAHLDPFGNPVRPRVRTAAEHTAEILMSIAGPMAQAELIDRDGTQWRQYASSPDMSIARHHRRELGDAAKSWEHYEQETLTLVRKFWPMIEAVAARLLKEKFLSGYDIDNICRRVVRRQHLKSA